MEGWRDGGRAGQGRPRQQGRAAGQRAGQGRAILARPRFQESWAESWISDPGEDEIQSFNPDFNPDTLASSQYSFPGLKLD